MSSKMMKYGCQGILSEEMEKYMVQYICEKNALEIITGAPISLGEKKTRLEKLRNCTNDLAIREDIDSCIIHIRNALSEVENISSDGFILSESCWYDIVDGGNLEYINRRTYTPPCSSYTELRKAILDEIEFETEVRDFDAFDTIWHEFIIWTKRQYSNGKTRIEKGNYKYIMIGSDICFIEESDPLRRTIHSADNWGYLAGSSDLNLPVPFKSGDIVTVDCRPFADVEHLLILNAENNWDCCGLRGAFADEDGKLHIDSVKHSHCFPMRYISRLSPLYRMRLYTGPLSENETVIKQIHLDMKDYAEEDRDIYGHIFENISTRWTMYEEGYLDRVLHLEQRRRGS